MRSNVLSSALTLGLVCAVLLGAGSLFLGPRTEAAGPPGGIDVRVINGEANPVPVTGVVGAEQVGDWTVGLAGGIGIDPGQNEVTVSNEVNVNVANEVSVKKGTRRLARFDLLLTEENPQQSFDIDARGSTKIRIAMTINSSSDRDADIFLLSMVPGEPNGSVLDEFEAGSSLSSRNRLYDLPGEQVRFRAIMDDDDDDAFRQVIVTVWGD